MVAGSIMSNHLNWASTLIRSLYKSGVSHAVISPGSRSTPLTLAAAIHPGIKKSIVLDERSAGFIALGIGKATGTPAVLICTSGTAAANYYPSVVEAKESGVPMIVLTADRPPNLRGIGSSQTIDQIKLYGDMAVRFHETGEPRFNDEDLKRLSYLGRQAVKDSVDLGGAVHINLPFRKPLEPTEEQIKHEKSIAEKEIDSNQGRLIEPSVKRSISFNKQILSLINSSKKPLIICGPANPHKSLADNAIEISEFLNAPVIAEPGSGIPESFSNKLSRYEQFLRAKRDSEKFKPDLILRFGDQPFTKSVLQTLDDWQDVPVIHVSSRKSVQDHSMSIWHNVECSGIDTISYSDLKCITDDNWTVQLKDVNREFQTKLETALHEFDSLTDGAVFSSLNNQLGEDWNCMLSNSFIPRDMALFGDTRPHQYVNRGAAGIDGIISTGIGISNASNRKTLCISGDLAFLHDSNALLSIKHAEKPFVIIVVNNGGGTIFNMLPVSNMKNYFEDYFITPQQVDIEKLADAHQINYRKIGSKTELSDLDLTSISSHTIIECVTDPAKSMELRKILWNY